MTDNQSPMTPKERAHKIADDLFHLPLGTNQDEAGEWLEKQITAQIEEAEKEAILKQYEGDRSPVTLIEQRAYAKGFRDAQVELVKMAKEMNKGCTVK